MIKIKILKQMKDTNPKGVIASKLIKISAE